LAGEGEVAPADDQVGNEAEGQHPGKATERFLRADEPDGEDGAGPVADGRGEEAEDEEGGGDKGDDLR
jgi:hypothetical protein